MNVDKNQFKDKQLNQDRMVAAREHLTIQTVNGLRVEIFWGKYYPSIDGLNRNNGNGR